MRLRPAPWRHRLAAILALALGVSACVAPTAWEPLPIPELVVESTAPGDEPELVTPTADQVERGWPSTVPIPTFVEDEFVGTIGGADGSRSASFDIKRQVSEEDVVDYMRALYAVGFTIDREAAAAGWFVRGGEWVRVSNIPTIEYYQAGDFSRPPDEVEGIEITWTTDPVRYGGYCFITEVGGETCRE